MTEKKQRRPQGEGALHRRANGTWAAIIELPPDPATGKRRRKYEYGKTKNEVVQKLRKMRSELEAAGDLPTSNPRLADWLKTWDKRHLSTLKPRSAESARGIVDRYIIPSLGKIRLNRLTVAHVHQMHDYITETLELSTTTANGAHRILRKALNDAIAYGQITRNVAAIARPPALAVTKREALTADEAKALLKHHAGDPHRALRLAVALMTGLRQGEALGLTWGAIDLDRGIIAVEWQLQSMGSRHGCDEDNPCSFKTAGRCPHRVFDYPAGQEIEQVRGALHLLRPKSRKGWREVPLAPVLKTMLTRYKKAFAREHPHDLVFLREDGHPTPPRQDLANWKAALKEAGLPDVPLHSARHTTATLLFELGVPEQVRMAILGHSSATVTQGYTHVADREAIAAMDSLGELLALES